MEGASEVMSKLVISPEWTMDERSQLIEAIRLDLFMVEMEFVASGRQGKDFVSLQATRVGLGRLIDDVSIMAASYLEANRGKFAKYIE